MDGSNDHGCAKCSCGKRVSKQGNFCRACFFANTSFKEKSCVSCGVNFKPKSGVQKKCDKCKFECSICKGKKRENSNFCLKCASKHLRLFNRTCTSCGDTFTDRNNKSLFCGKCYVLKNPMTCIDCYCKITKGKKRCNKCSAKNRSVEYYSQGWKKYEFNGIKYRSKWEIEFAKILLECDIEFKYEVFHQETKTRPDFYIVGKDFFIEIHPDYHGKKKALPDNCVLVKTLSHARAIAFVISYSLNKERAITYFNTLSKQARTGIYKIVLDLCVYLRTELYERNGK